MPNGYHKSTSVECGKVTETKGMPRCPDGFHIRPDGDCESVTSNEENDEKEVTTLSLLA